MGLQQQLDAFNAEFAHTAPVSRPALYEAKIKELRASFALDLLEAGPAVVTFYRGGWCPYCNIQLRAYQAALPEMTVLGARLIAISPQLPDSSLSTAEANHLAFDVLSDAGNRVARTFGLVWSLPEELRAALRSNNKALPEINGDDSWELRCRPPMSSPQTAASLLPRPTVTTAIAWSPTPS